MQGQTRMYLVLTDHEFNIQSKGVQKIGVQVYSNFPFPSNFEGAPVFPVYTSEVKRRNAKRKYIFEIEIVEIEENVENEEKGMNNNLYRKNSNICFA